MMKMKSVAMAVAAATLVISGAASADTYNWGGAYVGGSLGYNTLHTDTADYWCWYACDTPSTNSTHSGLSLNGGYNFQFDNNFVAGVELDLTSGMESLNEYNYGGGRGVSYKSKWNYLTTLRGRVGMAVDRTMLYVTGGFAMADGEFDATTYGYAPNSTANVSKKLRGTVAGVGIEHAFTDNLNFKLEYLDVAMNSADACWANANTGVCYNSNENSDNVYWSTSATLMRAGVNWKF